MNIYNYILYIITVAFVDVFRKVHKKTPVLESLFNKVAGLKAYIFIQKRHQHSCFPVNIAKYLRTDFFIDYLLWLLYL